MKIGRRGIATTAIVAIVVTVVIVVIAGVSAAVLLTPKEGAEGTPTSTGTGTATGTGTGTTTATGTTTPSATTTTTGGGLESATSLAFKVDVTAEETTGTIIFKMKDIGTDDMKVRMDVTALVNGTTQETSMIVNGELRKAWMYENGVWTDMSDNVSEALWDTLSEPLVYENVLSSFGVNLSGWTGGDYTYTDPTTGYSFRVHDFELNPVLEDSLFVHSG
jgi:hypothetical protein